GVRDEPEDERELRRVRRPMRAREWNGLVRDGDVRADGLHRLVCELRRERRERLRDRYVEQPLELWRLRQRVQLEPRRTELLRGRVLDHVRRRLRQLRREPRERMR